MSTTNHRESIERIRALCAEGYTPAEALDIVLRADDDDTPAPPPASAPVVPKTRTELARAALAAVHARTSDAEAARALLIAEGTADQTMADAMNDSEAMYAAGLEDRPLSAADQKIADETARYNADPRAEMLRSSQAELRRDWYRLSPAQRASDAEAYGLDVATVEAEMRQTRAASDEQRDFPTRRDFENQRAREQS